MSSDVRYELRDAIHGHSIVAPDETQRLLSQDIIVESCIVKP